MFKKLRDYLISEHILEELGDLNQRVSKLDIERCIIEKDIRQNAETKLIVLLTNLHELEKRVSNIEIQKKVKLHGHHSRS